MTLAAWWVPWRTMQDITGSRHAERERERLLGELSRTVTELDAALGASQNAFIVFSPDGRISRLNLAGQRLLGLTEREQSVPIPDRAVLRPALNSRGEVMAPHDLPGARALRGEIVVGVEVGMGAPAGGTTWFSCCAAPICTADGTTAGAVVTMSDISTVFHAMQEQREDFVRAFSHNLRNPLTVVWGEAQFLERRMHHMGLGSELAHVQAIERSSQHMQNML